MRTYGRVYDENGIPTWVVVETDANGFNDAVWLTTLCQVLLLNLQESPFYADWGLPDVPSIVTQVAPDYYVSIVQQRLAPYFASLSISRGISVDGITPTYDVAAVTQQGVAMPIVSVPQ